MLRLEFTTGDGQSAARRLTQLGKGVSDFQPLWEKIERDFYQMERDHWASQGDGKWAPNSGLYAERKAKHYPGRVVMELTGALYKSMTVQGAPGQVRRVSRSQLVIGTDIHYAAIHHYGSSKRMWVPAPFYFWINGLPTRPLINVKATDEERWRSLAEEFVADAARKAGL